MAYAESTIGGTYGGSFRVWVNSIQVTQGGAAENWEDWRVEGGVNRVSATGNRIYSSGASYTTQLGLNGVAISSGFNYDFNTALGVKVSWGSGTTRVYRDAAGVGYGFQARTDVNLNNSPYLTSGWTVSSDSVRTVYRQAYLTNLSQDITDMDDPWVEFSNPGGIQVNAWLEFPNLTGATRYFQNNYVGSRHTWVLSSGDRQTLRTVAANYNQSIIRYVIESVAGGAYFYDYRDRVYTVINGEPTFTDFDYEDTNSATVAVTGDDQVLIQGRSILEATVPVADKAIANKQATMSTYTFLVGAYSASEPWSNTVDVVKNMGTVSVTGAQNLSVRAVDSRGNTATSTKSVTILPYFVPVVYASTTVKYSNDYDETDGLTIGSSSLGYIAPMALGGVNKNSVNSTTGVQWDISKADTTSYSGVWKNVPSSVATNGLVTITDIEDLAGDILAAMNTLGADNSVRWYIKFRITDALDNAILQVFIDIGRPIFRIGTDNVLYHREFPIANPGVLSSTTNTAITPNTVAYGIRRFTALNSAITINAPSGSQDGQMLKFYFKDDGTARGITWNAIFRNIGAVAPLATIPNKLVVVGAIYNAADTKWDVVAVSQEG